MPMQRTIKKNQSFQQFYSAKSFPKPMKFVFRDYPSSVLCASEPFSEKNTCFPPIFYKNIIVKKTSVFKPRITFSKIRFRCTQDLRSTNTTCFSGLLFASQVLLVFYYYPLTPLATSSIVKQLSTTDEIVFITVPPLFALAEQANEYALASCSAKRVTTLKRLRSYYTSILKQECLTWLLRSEAEKTKSSNSKRVKVISSKSEAYGCADQVNESEQLSTSSRVCKQQQELAGSKAESLQSIMPLLKQKLELKACFPQLNVNSKGKALKAQSLCRTNTFQSGLQTRYFVSACVLQRPKTQRVTCKATSKSIVSELRASESLTFSIPFFNRRFDKKRLKLLFSWYYANKGERAAFSLVETLQKLGFTHAMKAGISLGIDDLKVPKTKTKSITEALELLNITKASVYSGDVTSLEEYQQFVDTWHRTSENLKTAVVQNFANNLNTAEEKISESFTKTREGNRNYLSPSIKNLNQEKQTIVSEARKTKSILGATTGRNSSKDKYTEKTKSNYGNTLNPVYMMAFSGARGNLSQVRQLVGMRGLMADPQGQLVDFPIQSNFREGLTVTEYMISCYGARKGLVDTALRTAAAGYLTRRLVDVAHHQIVRLVTCGTKSGIWLSTERANKIQQSKSIVLPSTWKVPLGSSVSDYFSDEVNESDTYSYATVPVKEVSAQHSRAVKFNYSAGLLKDAFTKHSVKTNSSELFKNQEYNKPKASSSTQYSKANNFATSSNTTEQAVRCVGRVLAHDIPGIAFRNQEIDFSLGSSSGLREIYETVGIYVRSPLTCQAESGICQLCYGWSVSANRLVGLGEAVGIVAAQSIGEPGTQLTMRTFHTGGVFSGDIMEECRAKHAGMISFHGRYFGLMVRTAGGAIAFCIKTPGSFEITNVKTSEVTTYHLRPNSLLFVRQGEKVLTGSLLAQIPNLPEIEENTGESTKTIVSNFSGEVRQIPTISKSLETIRILAAQKNSPLYVINFKKFHNSNFFHSQQKTGSSNLLLKNSGRRSVYGDYGLSQTDYNPFQDIKRGYCFADEGKPWRNGIETPITQYTSNFAGSHRLGISDHKFNNFYFTSNSGNIKKKDPDHFNPKKYCVSSKKSTIKDSWKDQECLNIKKLFGKHSGEANIVLAQIRQQGYTVEMDGSCFAIKSTESLQRVLHNKLKTLFRHKPLNLEKERLLAFVSYDASPFFCNNKTAPVPTCNNTINITSTIFPFPTAVLKQEAALQKMHTGSFRSLINWFSFVTKEIIKKNKIKLKKTTLSVSLFKLTKYFAGGWVMPLLRFQTGKVVNLFNKRKKPSALHKKPVSAVLGKNQFKSADVLLKNSGLSLYLGFFSWEAESFAIPPLTFHKPQEKLVLNHARVLQIWFELIKERRILNFVELRSYAFLLWTRNFIVDIKSYNTCHLDYSLTKKRSKPLKNPKSTSFKQGGKFFSKFQTRINLNHKPTLPIHQFTNDHVKTQGTCEAQVLISSTRAMCTKEDGVKKDLARLNYLKKKINSFVVQKTQYWAFTAKTQSLSLEFSEPYWSCAESLKTDSNFISDRLCSVARSYGEIFPIQGVHKIPRSDSVLVSKDSWPLSLPVKVKNLSHDVKHVGAYKSSGILSNSDRVSYKLLGEKFTTSQDPDYNTSSHFMNVKVGCFINTGDEIFKNFGSPNCGQVIEKSADGVTLRKTQTILYSNLKFRPAIKSNHVKNGNWLSKGTDLVTLPYISSVTGDIVAGIPKIEQLFEARGNSLQETVDRIWDSYKSVTVPRAKAARECFKEIGLFVAAAIQKVYSSQGVHIADKHLEVIIRQMTRRALIIEPGDTPFLTDEFIDLKIIECVNWTSYGQPATYRPHLIGITKASLTSNSFLSSASFQQTARVLEREAFLEKTDRLLGLKERVMMGALIDAGTGSTSSSYAKQTNVVFNPSAIKQTQSITKLVGVTQKPFSKKLASEVFQLDFFSRKAIEQTVPFS